MSAKPAIQINNLSKRYRLGVINRETLTEEVRYWLLKMTGRDPAKHMLETGSEGTEAKELWALKDVSFDVNEGEVVGILGRNGAGKSTLLKVLSRITDPTEGDAKIHGRVGSLLEVGTGFHPELTGRENVYLNGTFLGMKHAEIESKFDEIVAFSEMAKHLDTPVKRYSSGMKVRLAFAVAAHLEPEILLIDEVLAVGDARFQKNCLGKMGEVAESGRTILFVSHQMNAIRSLCSRAVWMDNGQVVEDGDPDEVIARYLEFNAGQGVWTAEDSGEHFPNAFFVPSRFAIVDRNLQPLQREVKASESFGLMVEGTTEELNDAVMVGFEIFASSGESVFMTNHTDTRQQDWPVLEKGENRLVVWIPPHLLNEGFYRIELKVSLFHQEWIVKPGFNAPSLGLQVSGGLSDSPLWMKRRRGILAPVLPFKRV